MDAHGDVYTDSGTASVVKLSHSGKLHAHWNVLRLHGGHPDTASGIAPDGHGHVCISDLDADRIVKLSTTLQPRAERRVRATCH